MISSSCGSNKLDKLVLTGNTCSKLSSSYTETQSTFQPLQGFIELLIYQIRKVLFREIPQRFHSINQHTRKDK